MRKKNGFTLVELIIVIAVIGILAAILIPVFANVIEKSNAKSALSDAKNLITSFITHMNEEGTTDVPDLIAAVHKGSNMYIFAYDADGGKLLECKSNPFDYNEKSNIRANAVIALSELEKQGAISPSDSAGQYGEAYTVKLVKSLKYDPNEISIFPDYDVNISKFNEIEDLEIDVSLVPSASVEYGQIVIEPIFDPAEEMFVYTIYSEDANRLAYSEYDSFKLDISELTDGLAEMTENNTTQWYGYGIKIVDQTGLGFNNLKMKFENNDLLGVLNGTNTLSSDKYPYITKSEAFETYMESIGYATVNQENTEAYIAKVENGTLSETYADYLEEKYGTDIPINKLAEVCSGERVGELRHAEAEVAEKIFKYMYNDGFTYSFLTSYSSDMFNRFETVYSGLKTSMTEGWKTAGEIKFMSVYDLLVANEITDFNFASSGDTISGAIMFTWHENVVPAKSDYEKPVIELYLASDE